MIEFGIMLFWIAAVLAGHILNRFVRAAIAHQRIASGEREAKQSDADADDVARILAKDEEPLLAEFAKLEDDVKRRKESIWYREQQKAQRSQGRLSQLANAVEINRRVDELARNATRVADAYDTAFGAGTGVHVYKVDSGAPNHAPSTYRPMQEEIAAVNRFLKQRGFSISENAKDESFVLHSQSLPGSISIPKEALIEAHLEGRLYPTVKHFIDEALTRP